jgi:hypothetical protein
MDAILRSDVLFQIMPAWVHQRSVVPLPRLNGRLIFRCARAIMVHDVSP